MRQVKQIKATLKKSILTIIFAFSLMTFFDTQIPPSKQQSGFGVVIHGQNLLSNSSYNDVISKFKNFSARQLLDTAYYYFKRNDMDTALVCYNLLINNNIGNTDFEQQKIIVEAFYVSATIYLGMSDYNRAYEFLIKALLLCEKINYQLPESMIYTSIGNIYYYFNEYDVAKQYYLKALNLCQDSTSIVVMLNNIGAVEVESGKFDSAFYFLTQSLQLSKRHNDAYLYTPLNTMASLYQKSKLYDSAFHYYRLSLDDAKKRNKVEIEVENLSNLSNLFFEINKIDSALFYINLSNALAEKNNFLGILVKNYLTLFKIEEAKGNNKTAFEYFKKHALLKDSIFNAKNFGEINQMQRMYEVSKANQQIEELAIERKIKERTIFHQKIILFITLIVLLIMSFAFFQKRKLNIAYKKLFEKNLKIVHLQENLVEDENTGKYKSSLTYDMQQELMDKILVLMKDTPTICDPKFTIDKLAELVGSNQTYISQTINTVLKKNFRSFLNEYRIEEAQRLFSQPDAIKYTIESVSLQVGFKSQNAFRNAFTEITGMSPYFYLKSMREYRNS